MSQSSENGGEEFFPARELCDRFMSERFTFRFVSQLFSRLLHYDCTDREV